MVPAYNEVPGKGKPDASRTKAYMDANAQGLAHKSGITISGNKSDVLKCGVRIKAEYDGMSRIENKNRRCRKRRTKGLV